MNPYLHQSIATARGDDVLRAAHRRRTSNEATGTRDSIFERIARAARGAQIAIARPTRLTPAARA